MPKEINNQQNIQLARLEERVKNIEKMVGYMTTNCIPTLTKTCAKLDANQKIILFFMFAIIAALIGLYFR
jgi:cob(I)alamin adenosyltransferase